MPGRSLLGREGGGGGGGGGGAPRERFRYLDLKKKEHPPEGKRKKERKQTTQTRDGRRTGSPPARAGVLEKDDQGHRAQGNGT